MHISPEQLEEFKEILKGQVNTKKFNTMSEQEILESAYKLLRLLKVIYKPMTQEEFEFITKRRKESSTEDEEKGRMGF